MQCYVYRYPDPEALAKVFTAVESGEQLHLGQISVDGHVSQSVREKIWDNQYVNLALLLPLFRAREFRSLYFLPLNLYITAWFSSGNLWNSKF